MIKQLSIGTGGRQQHILAVVQHLLSLFLLFLVHILRRLTDASISCRLTPSALSSWQASIALATGHQKGVKCVTSYTGETRVIVSLRRF